MVQPDFATRPLSKIFFLGFISIDILNANVNRLEALLHPYYNNSYDSLLIYNGIMEHLSHKNPYFRNKHLYKLVLVT